MSKAPLSLPRPNGCSRPVSHRVFAVLAFSKIYLKQKERAKRAPYRRDQPLPAFHGHVQCLRNQRQICQYALRHGEGCGLVDRSPELKQTLQWTRCQTCCESQTR